MREAHGLLPSQIHSQQITIKETSEEDAFASIVAAVGLLISTIVTVTGGSVGAARGASKSLVQKQLERLTNALK